MKFFRMKGYNYILLSTQLQKLKMLEIRNKENPEHYMLIEIITVQLPRVRGCINYDTVLFGDDQGEGSIYHYVVGGYLSKIGLDFNNLTFKVIYN